MFSDIKTLLQRFQQLQAIRVFCKPLAENDNSKQQIYLGGSLDVVQMFPSTKIESNNTGVTGTYKVKLDFFWIDDGVYEQARGAQLILYPQYPEVRLSGFLRGCSNAPNELMRPTPKELRQSNNAADGRVLFFGITAEGHTLAYAAARGSGIANEFEAGRATGRYKSENLLYTVSLQGEKTSRELLLETLRVVWQHNPHASARLDSAGRRIPYQASNGGGYTLEALLNIIPNGRAEPDYLGWEIKSFRKSAITLMTPEPNGGFYAEHRVAKFVMRFGHPVENNAVYFTGLHRVGEPSQQTGLILQLRGFDQAKQIITDVNGAVELLTDTGECAASWSFAKLMASWNKKHSQAAYIRYSSEPGEIPKYNFLSPVGLGEGTSFTHYLNALQLGRIVYDPASKVSNVSSGKPSVKARSQFRISYAHLPMVYRQFEHAALSP
jgi:hypothetical protein